jgi:hypothetical protein
LCTKNKQMTVITLIVKEKSTRTNEFSFKKITVNLKIIICLFYGKGSSTPQFPSITISSQDPKQTSVFVKFP